MERWTCSIPIDTIREGRTILAIAVWDVPLCRLDTSVSCEGVAIRRRDACRTLPSPATNDLWCGRAFHVGVFCGAVFMSVCALPVCHVKMARVLPSIVCSLFSFSCAALGCFALHGVCVSLVFRRPSYVLCEASVVRFLVTSSKTPVIVEDDARQPFARCPGEKSLKSWHRFSLVTSTVCEVCVFVP